MPLCIFDMPNVCSLSRPAFICFIFFFDFLEIFDKQAESTEDVLRERATELYRDLLLTELSECLE